MSSRSEVPAEFATAPANLATDRQLSYLSDLIDERQIPDEVREQIRARIESREVAKQLASEWIERLRSKPKRDSGSRVHVQYTEVLLDNDEVRRVGQIVVPGEPPTWVLAGRYGIDTTGDDRFTNDTTFFKVWVGDRGGWNVRMFKSDDEMPLAFPTQLAVLKVIAKDPAKAMALFGHEFGRCGLCGRGLTNDLSREIGIGPVCRERL